MKQFSKYILVTGGAGFIGSNLCRLLVQDKSTFVLSLDNLYTGSKNNLVGLEGENFSFLEEDILNPKLGEILDKYRFDQIYHLACPASPPAYQKDPLNTLKINTVGTFNILDIACKHKSRVLFSSTSETYGDPLEHPQKETYRGNVNTMGPRACYDEGKRISETIFYEYNQTRGLEIRIARIFNTYGPYMSPEDGRVITNFTKQAVTNSDVTIYGTGKQTRSICFISDLLDGLCKLMNNNEHIGPINIGNPIELTILEIAELIIQLTNSKSKITYHDLPQDDPTKRRPDIERAKSVLNWEPKVSPKEGLLKTIEWIKEKVL
eukprot:TRINITY_DN2918_c2_g1_i1.p1 TRINITY_DN2918_c2_g1~~TRINITY_DN2918_c2_g1_i1.p1  ORF type:complete len:321 (-),score=87.40 TRINITY_DN2918_c2_g1_i1:60-1022(-)